MRHILLTIALLGVGTAALAECPSTTPDASRFPTIDGDQRVSAAWLNDTLSGNRLVLSEGTEVYNSDGSYSYLIDGDTYNAPSYRFYDNGLRCTDYPSPRFDLYVVNNGSLVLINGQGGRYVGELRD
jgi:hypothetical protein